MVISKITNAQATTAQTLTYLQHMGEKTDLPRAASTAQYELVRALPRRGQSSY